MTGEEDSIKKASGPSHHAVHHKRVIVRCTSPLLLRMTDRRVCTSPHENIENSVFVTLSPRNASQVFWRCFQCIIGPSATCCLID